MLFSAGEFTLIENERCFTSADFIPQQRSSASAYIEVKYQPTSTNSLIVSAMLQALVNAQAYGIPVIFNRTSQDIELSELPEGCAVGILTSGTTGAPKLVYHQLEALLPKNTKVSDAKTCWLLCYHPMSYAGLQVILQAIVANDTLVVDVDASLQKKSQLAIELNVTAISATPSFMRTLLMAWHQRQPELRLISLGGEIAEQSTLDTLKRQFPRASIRHIYATTETGVIFSVKDGLAGFPFEWCNTVVNGWLLKIDDTLKLIKGNVEIDTGDCIQSTSSRVIFSGRADNVVNIGGVKVNLELLEQQIIAFDIILDARVYVKANPITGFLTCVEICTEDEEKARRVLRAFFSGLAPASRPRVITFSKQIALNLSGKKQRIV
ncbi:Acyl-CoA synthetases (AMP-forming)/AMP-acid ligases II-like protein [Shewanella denitrificans OS217]|uniref:Acyl-CoA synthetases (AMP-forming)/AMP-acid ligases II-like protein n=1 Tax=Shewanella denitrificans (strain OS217 / ATCC BAA-1090 / DSM 15013) TaxID=318161 RepID=Q12JJ2_SHEDO|nr:class I adenylate-forming enzyme family protein [Shewanella denitrificans]ABE56384.1 Acyl-CoA synthetases (AMP-forming)/AMP-acid ligases II-like protein [Shewanella denitrificans OS217]